MPRVRIRDAPVQRQDVGRERGKGLGEYRRDDVDMDGLFELFKDGPRLSRTGRCSFSWCGQLEAVVWIWFRGVVRPGTC